MKFNRGYNLLIKTHRGQLIEIDPEIKSFDANGKVSTGPLTIHFVVTRDTSGTPNGCKIEIYNLGLDNRNRLHKDKFNVTEYWQVILSAGYDRQLHQVFKGDIREAWSEKTGTEWITHLDCYDGRYAIHNSYFSQSINKNQNILQALFGMIKEAGLNIGFFGDAAKTQSTRGQVIEGNITDAANQTLEGMDVYINNEELNALGPGDVIKDVVYKLDSDQLLKTPQKRDMKMELETLFYPEIDLGRIVEVRSSIPQYDGQYMVIGFEHDVTISGAEAGTAITKITVLAPQRKPVATVTQDIPPATPPTPPRTHKVVPGETLRKIADHYYKDEKKYPVIIAANIKLLQGRPLHPDDGSPIIYPGDILIIPELE